MSPGSQKIAIAKILDLPNVHYIDHVLVYGGEYPDVRSVPDYPSDLNAMHEAEEWLFRGGGSLIEYVNRLRLVCGQFPEYATAAIRAESFLRTVNKWEGAK